MENARLGSRAKPPPAYSTNRTPGSRRRQAEFDSAL